MAGSRLRAAGVAVALSAAGLAVCSVAPGAASAAPGGLDPTFGSGGIAAEQTSNVGTGVAVVPAGVAGGTDVVVSGYYQTSGSPAFQVTRLTPTGSPDGTFGSSGVASAITGEALSVGVAANGMILAGGWESTPSVCGGRTPIVAEYTTAGSLSTSFGAGGIAAIPCPTSFPGAGQVNSLAVQPDGSIVFGGFLSSPSSTHDLLVGRLTATGGLDPGFASGAGYEALAVGGAGSPAQGVTVAGNGDVVTAGVTYPVGTTGYPTLVAFTAAGALDPAFTCSTAGCTSPSTGVEYLSDQAEGSFYTVLGVPGTSEVVAGGSSASAKLLLGAFSDTGAPVAGFGSSGEQVSGSAGTWFGLAYQAAGNFLTAAGQSGSAIVASQLNPSTGALNGAFGSGGVFTQGYSGSRPASALAVAAQPDGRTVLAGSVPVVNAVQGLGVLRLSGPSVSLLPAQTVQVTAYGNVTFGVPAAVDEPLSTASTAVFCASSGSVDGGGLCGNVTIPAGTTNFVVPVTVDVTVSPGNDQVVDVAALPGSGVAPSGQNATVTIVHLPSPPSFEGYWMVASDGGIFSFGGASFHGSTGAVRLNKPIVGMAPTPDGGGYWLVASDGGIFAFGDARFFGSTGAVRLNKPIVGMAATADGGGYWLVASDGGIFAFGDARFFGSTGGIRLNQPIVGMAATPDGGGYWMVASDGGIFSFGDASFHGSTGNVHLAKPIVGMAADPAGPGYWMVASDGGIFSFGAASFHGSTGNVHLAKPIVGMAPTSDGAGYWMVASDGGIFTFGDASFYGSTGGIKLNKPIVGMAT